MVPATTEIYTLSLHDALPICGLAAQVYCLVHGRPARHPAALRTRHLPRRLGGRPQLARLGRRGLAPAERARAAARSEEHTSELQSRQYLVCRLLLEKKKNKNE